MRRARGDKGQRLFTVTEFLSVEQVASFSRLAAKGRHQKATITEEDVCAAVEEDNFEEARKKIMTSLNLQHPIIVDQYNVCEMVKDNSLKKFKVDMLRILCEELMSLQSHQKGKRLLYRC